MREVPTGVGFSRSPRRPLLSGAEAGFVLAVLETRTKPHLGLEMETQLLSCLKSGRTGSGASVQCS